jgi:hypothetical protein
VAKETPDASPAEAETATMAALSEPGDAGEQTQIEQQYQQAAEAEASREQAQEAELKNAPEGAAAPTEKSAKSGGEVSYARSRFLDPTEGPVLTGLEHHVIAGALFLDGTEYQTVADVQAAAEAWLTTPVGAPADESDQG